MSGSHTNQLLSGLQYVASSPNNVFNSSIFQIGRSGAAGNPGYLMTTVTRLGDVQRKTEKFNLKHEIFQYGMYGDQGIQVDYGVWDPEVHIGKDCLEVPEMLAAAFSSTVLFLLCEPQPQLFLNNGIKAELLPTKRGNKGVYKHPSAYVPYFLHFGYMEPMYSNSWIYWHHHYHMHHYRFDWKEDGDGGVETEGGDPVCPWDPDGTEDHSNDGAIAESGGHVGIGDAAAVCGGCGSCTTGGGVGISVGLPCDSGGGGGNSGGTACGRGEGGGNSGGPACGSGGGGGDYGGTAHGSSGGGCGTSSGGGGCAASSNCGARCGGCGGSCGGGCGSHCGGYCGAD